jgi:CcmD family protein
MENAGYLFAAYALIWATVFGYVLLLINKQKRLRQDLESLEKALQEKDISSGDINFPSSPCCD